MEVHQNTEMDMELVEKDDDPAISGENPSGSGQTEEEDDFSEEITPIRRRDYSEIKAELALAKRLDTLLQKVEVISRSLDLGSNDDEPTEEDTLLSDSTVTHFDSTPSYLVNGQLKDYQLQGLNWMISLYERGVNGLLADEMGLGKTIQTIALLGYLKHYRRKNSPPGCHLVVVPKSTIANWKNEFEKWCPSIRVLSVHGTKSTRRSLLKRIKPGRWDVCLTTYETVIMEKTYFRKFQWCYLVIDESARLKNENSVFSINMRALNSKYRLLLTGVPLQNDLHELWALLNFLVPNIFNSSEDFDAWFNTESLGNACLVQRLHAILRPFYLRRVKSDVEKAIPPKKEIKIYISLTKMEKEVYAKIFARATKDILALNNYRTHPMAVWHNLRKCCNHLYLFSEYEPGPPYITDMHLVNSSSKMRVLDKLLLFLRDQGSRILLFSQFKIMLNIIEDYLCWRKFPYCRLDGDCSFEDREQQIYNFNKPDSKKFIFMLSTRAGGLGINLNTADVVIFYDSDFNPHWDLQAMDRAHRIGQTKTVRVFRLVTENTIEDRLIEVAETKMRLESIVIEKGRRRGFYCSKISRDEVVKIIRQGADHILASKDTEIIDEDIESIIEKSEKKTRERQIKLESMGESTLKRLFCHAPDDYQESLKDAGNEHSIQLSKQNHAVSSDNDANSINLQFESVEESPSENCSSIAPEDYQECQKDAGIEHLIRLPKRKRTASSEVDLNSISLQLESIEDNTLKRFSSNEPEDYQECQKDVGIKNVLQLPKRKCTASYDIDPKCRDLMASEAETSDQELKQKSLRLQNHKEPKCLKIPSEQKSERNKRDKILKSIQTSENVGVSTNIDKNLKTFSTLRNICMDHLKKVVQTAIQFQRHSHSRRLCASHFSKALTAHGFHFESDFTEDFLDFCTSEKFR